MVSGNSTFSSSRLLAGFFLPIVFTGRLLAQDASPPATATAESGKLDIRECVEQALLYNLSLQADRLDPELAREQTQVAIAEFDPTLNVIARTGVTQQSISSSDLDGSDGPRNETFAGRLGVSKKVDTGGTISLSTNMDRLLTNSEFSTLNPAYDADVAVAIRQPLLNGFGTDVNRAARERSLVGVDRADYVLQARVLDVVKLTESAFYDLAFQRATRRVRLSALEVAEKFLEENRVRRSSGMATNLDVTQAEVGVAEQKALVLNSEQAVSDAEDQLRTLLGELPFDVPVPELNVDLSTGEIPSVSAAYGTALDNQPEYLAALAYSDQLGYDVILARSGSRPSLDLGGALGYTGRDDSFKTAYEGIPTGEGYRWQVDLTLSIPWAQREGRARLQQTEIILRREELRIRDLEQAMMRDIRVAVRAAQTGLERVEIAQLRSRLSQEEYDLEKAKFDAGLSTSRLVLDALNRSDLARVSEMDDYLRLKNAVSELRRVQGVSLNTYGITMLPPPADDEAKSDDVGTVSSDSES